MASLGELSFGSIVHVNEKGGSFGGTEEYISLVTSELSRRGVRSHLVCGVLGGTVPLELDSVHVVDGLAAREPLRQLGPQLVQLIGTLDPDVIYLHNMFDPVAVRAVSAMPNRGPLIWYVHDHYLTCLSELRWRRDHGSCRERLGAGCLVAITEGRCVLRHPERALDADELGRREALSRSLSQTDEVIVVSEYMRSLLVEAQPHLAERIHLLPRPIRHPDATRKRQRTRSDEPAVITYAGRITPEKGLAVLIEALGSVRSDSRVELCIAGVVEHHGYWSHCQVLVQRATMANAQLRVSYRGHLDYAATDELFSQSDIVAVPSQWPEPLGAVALEAMSAGATVVASQIGGLDTCLDAGHSGSLVEPSHVTGWARAIEAQLHDPRRAGQLAARGQAGARSHTVQSHLIALDQAIRRARTDDVPCRGGEVIRRSGQLCGADGGDGVGGAEEWAATGEDDHEPPVAGAGGSRDGERQAPPAGDEQRQASADAIGDPGQREATEGCQPQHGQADPQFSAAEAGLVCDGRARDDVAEAAGDVTERGHAPNCPKPEAQANSAAATA